MALNLEKRQYMLMGNYDKLDKINLTGTEITSRNKAKLVSVLINKKIKL